MTDDRIDYRRLAELYDEFDELWTRLQAFYLDAVAGFRFVASCMSRRSKAKPEVLCEVAISIRRRRRTNGFSDTIKSFSHGFCTSEIHRATQGQAKARNAEGGSNFITLGRVCLISFYDFWEDYLRREYVVAKGRLDPNERREEVINPCVATHASRGRYRKGAPGIVHHGASPAAK